MEGATDSWNGSGLPARWLAAALLATSPAAAEPRFQLLSEKWINLSSGGESGTFTSHFYDASGNRTRTEIHIGLDGSGELFEKREFAYGASGLLERQSNYYGDGLDSRIVHSYGEGNRLSAKVVSGADGAERFRDAFDYDSQGRLAAEVRWKGEVRTSMHRYAYASDGSPASDTLFEPEGSAMVAVQAVIQGAGRTAAERRESRFRRQNGAWYHVQDTFRMSAGGMPLYTVAYQVGGKRIDSTAYGHDGHGNKVYEDRFTGAGLPLSRLLLSWRDLQSNSVRPPARRDPRGPHHPVILLSGRAGTGWRRHGSDLMGRGPGTPALRIGG